MCLMQVIPKHGQRLYELVNWSGHEDLREKVVVAEETIYHDETDPLVNWDERDLETAVREAGLSSVRIVVERQSAQRQITSAHVQRWFSEKGERLSYKERLLADRMTVPEVEKVEQLYSRQLVNQMVGWKTAVGLVTAS